MRWVCFLNFVHKSLLTCRSHTCAEKHWKCRFGCKKKKKKHNVSFILATHRMMLTKNRYSVYWVSQLLPCLICLTKVCVRRVQKPDVNITKAKTLFWILWMQEKHPSPSRMINLFQVELFSWSGENFLHLLTLYQDLYCRKTNYLNDFFFYYCDTFQNNKRKAKIVQVL